MEFSFVYFENLRVIYYYFGSYLEKLSQVVNLLECIDRVKLYDIFGLIFIKKSIIYKLETC